jgi:hypothetical protein
MTITDRTTAQVPTKRVPMTSLRKTALAAGLLSILTLFR